MIGVIVTSYNKCDHLRQCLRALSYEKYCTVDVVVADDGSDDGTVELLESLGTKYWRREGRRKKDISGISTAVNNAVLLLRPTVEVICIAQADVIFEPQFLWWAKHFVRPRRAVCGLGNWLAHGPVSDEAIDCMYRELTGWGGGGKGRFLAHYAGGDSTLVEMEDWRTIDDAAMCLAYQDMIPWDERLTGVGGHWMPEWALRLRMRGIHFYTTPLMRFFHQAHDINRDPELTRRGRENIERLYGSEIWRVASTNDTFYQEQFDLSGPLNRRVLHQLANMEYT
jgi:glycosyltransferase involved in cell wall biosynthesis